MTLSSLQPSAFRLKHLLSLYTDAPDATVRIFDSVRPAPTNVVSSGVFAEFILQSGASTFVFYLKLAFGLKWAKPLELNRKDSIKKYGCNPKNITKM